MMMGLGSYRFALNTAAYQALTRSDSYGWVEQQRLGRKPAMQIPAEAATTINLNGVIFPDWSGGGDQIEQMRQAANRQEPLMLVSGNGKVFGLYVILSINESQSYFKQHGTPRKQEFSLSLKEYGSDSFPWPIHI